MANKFKVNFYKEPGVDVSNSSLHILCGDCAKESGELEFIDVAGTWDECSVCGIQNAPSWPSGFMTRDEYGRLL